MMRGYLFPVGYEHLIAYVEGLPFYSGLGEVDVVLYQVDPDVAAPKVVSYFCGLAAAVKRVKDNIVFI